MQVDFDEFYHWYTQGNADPDSPGKATTDRLADTDTRPEDDKIKVGITYKAFTGFSN